MSVLNVEPPMLSKKVGIPFALFAFSPCIWVWFVPSEYLPLVSKIIAMVVFPIYTLMILAWTKFGKDK